MISQILKDMNYPRLKKKKKKWLADMNRVIKKYEENKAFLSLISELKKVKIKLEKYIEGKKVVKKKEESVVVAEGEKRTTGTLCDGDICPVDLSHLKSDRPLEKEAFAEKKDGIFIVLDSSNFQKKVGKWNYIVYFYDPDCGNCPKRKKRYWESRFLKKCKNMKC